MRTVGVSTDRYGRAALAACPCLTRAAESSVLLRQMQHSAVSGKGLNSPDEGAPGSSRARRSGSGLLDGVPALRDFADAPFDSPLLATIL